MSEAARIEALEARIRELEEELAVKTVLVETLFDHNPDGVTISDASANLVSNGPARAMMRSENATESHEEWSKKYGIFREDQVTPYGADDNPLMRTLRDGEVIVDEVLFAIAPNRPEGMFMNVSTRPLPNGGALLLTRDVTERRLLAKSLEERNAELAQREQENRALIERLRVAVDDLSTPVLEIWDDILTLPVVGIVDTQRSAQMTDKVLNEVVKSRAKYVIVDLTGVELIDTSTADRFLRLARSVQLLGARCVITGIQPQVSQTLVDLDVEFGMLETHRNLKSALEACIRKDARAPVKKGATSRAASRAVSSR
jgi:rsbT co-antagonist protein RsbR